MPLLGSQIPARVRTIAWSLCVFIHIAEQTLFFLESSSAEIVGGERARVRAQVSDARVMCAAAKGTCHSPPTSSPPAPSPFPRFWDTRRRAASSLASTPFDLDLDLVDHLLAFVSSRSTSQATHVHGEHRCSAQRTGGGAVPRERGRVSRAAGHNHLVNPSLPPPASTLLSICTVST